MTANVGTTKNNTVHFVSPARPATEPGGFFKLRIGRRAGMFPAGG